ncbi:MAG: hypothetical protein H0U51_10750 [Propionibacteriales bacterium]|nr:hypothetical protein [Propionibacteriales bacterium]
MIARWSDRVLRRRLAAAVASCTVGLGALIGCSAQPKTEPEPETEPAVSADSTGTGRDVSTSTATTGAAQPIDEGGPLVALPACDAPPEGVEADVAGLVLPEGAVVTEVEDLGKLVSVRAYIEQTPVQVRLFYAKEPGLELFEIEDEIYEAEVLFGAGHYRSYVKVQAQCQQGSLLLAYVGPGDSGDLPSVGGG